MKDYIDVVFDGPPSHESGRFVEVEDAGQRSISVGEWIDRGDGLWALRIPSSRTKLAAAREAIEEAPCPDKDTQCIAYPWSAKVCGCWKKEILDAL